MNETSMIDQVVSAVVDTIGREYVQVEVSARHVHLSQADLEKLFGPGTTLTPKRELSQPGQFLSEQRVTLVGPKGEKKMFLCWDLCGKQPRWNCLRVMPEV